jgi:hypothetical protein
VPSNAAISSYYSLFNPVASSIAFILSSWLFNAPVKACISSKVALPKPFSAI